MLEQLELVVSSAGIREQKARQAAEIIRKARNYRWVGIYDVLESEIALNAFAEEDVRFLKQCASALEPLFARS